MNQAIQLSEIDNGPITQWDDFKATNEEYTEYETGYSPKDIYNKYFKPYLKDVRTEVDEENRNYLNVYFQDGSIMSFGNAAVVYFINEKALESKYYGTDKFAFFFEPNATSPCTKFSYGKGIEPYSFCWDNTVEGLKSNKDYGCSYNTSENMGAYCTMLIKLNGWKIPKDYPFKF